jgi:pimeloyl-ACP methyl ester carboxylesterase
VCSVARKPELGVSGGGFMTPIVLIHGGGFDGRCWDLVVPLLEAPALAVDLPGRGRRPAPPDSVSLEACADAVVADADAAGFDEIVLVGHSLAGCSMPFVAQRLGARVRHAVFVACTLPDEGASAFDTLDPEIQSMIDAAGPSPEPTLMNDDLARLVLGDDLDDQQLAWCVERLVPEAPGLIRDSVSLEGLKGVAATWLRTERDEILPPDKQSQFIRNVPDCRVVDVDAGHMCMVSRPAAVADLLNEIGRT